MRYSLRLFGGVALEADGAAVGTRARQRHRLAMLAALAANSRGALPRQTLMGMLWPDRPEKSARHLLTEAIHVVRADLGEAVLETSATEVALEMKAFRCDWVEFRKAVEAEDWAAAAEEYSGAFLEGFYLDGAVTFERWAETTRERAALDYGRALAALAEAAEEAGDLYGAVEWWGRSAVHEPHSTPVALGLMKALARAGERARAVRFAAAFAARTREELEMEPDPQVLEAMDHLRAHAGPTPPSGGLSRGESSPEGSPSGGAAAAPGAHADAPAAPALELDGLEVIRKIGEGSVAEVYLAREPALGRLVAVKVLAERYAGDGVAQRRFEREARSAARIQHPHVTTVHRIGATPAGAPFLVLPYVSGGSLEDRLAATGRLAVAEARRCMAQLAAGLAAAHRLGIVHRDVRPANLLYDRDTDRVLLTDFGLATVLESGPDVGMRLTRPGQVLGDPAFASPEQLRAEPVTERADVYSLGMVTFHLLTGRSPFAAMHPAQLIVAHQREVPARASAFRPEIDAELDELVHRCLNKRPEHRPFAADVAEALGWG
jgi:DNA-binding SARP family transcriptional activator/tRNA A-37 threonylcarbamoyl transferase component Bud32